MRSFVDAARSRSHDMPVRSDLGLKRPAVVSRRHSVRKTLVAPPSGLRSCFTATSLPPSMAPLGGPRLAHGTSPRPDGRQPFVWPAPQRHVVRPRSRCPLEVPAKSRLDDSIFTSYVVNGAFAARASALPTVAAMKSSTIEAFAADANRRSNERSSDRRAEPWMAGARRPAAGAEPGGRSDERCANGMSIRVGRKRGAHAE